jgi:lipopolysaccharide assembly outer membrane protein LptD (OstA)
MNKKIIVQAALFLTLLIIIFFFYYEYFFLKKETIYLTNKNQNINVPGSGNNLIKSLEYLSTDENGNKYLINAEYGEISGAEDGIILMTNVTSRIDLFERDTVYLTSDFAKYNTFNLDTNFSKNVILQYTGHKITSENIDLSFKKNFAWVYKNIVYKSSANQIFADKLEIDLLTKDSRIFMNGNKKLKVIGK